MLLIRLSRNLRPIYVASRARYLSSDHGHGHHQPEMEEYDGVNRRINPVIRHNWEHSKEFEDSQEFTYRDPRWDKDGHIKGADHYFTMGLTGFMWAWLFYHIWYEGHELYQPEASYPDAKTWSDEHLGIPSDDEGLAPEKKWLRTTEIPWAVQTTLNYSRSWCRHNFDGDEGPWKM